MVQWRAGFVADRLSWLRASRYRDFIAAATRFNA
jgi:hypothetical protein